uniref:Transmembrane protein n=1 Tax=Caenorhabditis tropicalis TaxID=1561998 RepID=A0A1I7U0D5_9PELO
MGYLFGIGDGIWIGFGIILGSIGLCIVNGRSKGLPSVITYLLLAVFFLALLLWWPIKNIDEPPADEKTRTDMILIPRIIFLILLPIFTVYLINLYIKHNLFSIVRAESTADRHSKTWIADSKIKNT